MISIKKYLDSTDTEPEQLAPEPVTQAKNTAGPLKAVPIKSVAGKAAGRSAGSAAGDAVLATAMESYRSALLEMGKCSVDACPALGPELKRKLGKVAERLGPSVAVPTLESSEKEVREELQDWGRQTAEHYHEKTEEVKEMLLVLARTAESVGERDQRCAGQLTAVTGRLKNIATLEDLSQIRASIEASAAELKGSIDRMAAESKACVDQLRSELTVYQGRLEKVEEMASRDGLTGLRNRHWVENQIQKRIAAEGPLSLAIVDIDGFKQVNDEHGHVVGDEVLQQFAAELHSTCRSTDLTGRWGGDEFILVMDCGYEQAQAKVERLRMWVCGTYKVQGKSAGLKLSVEASIGLAEHRPGESMTDLVHRADSAMYAHKAASRKAERSPEAAAADCDARSGKAQSSWTKR